MKGLKCFVICVAAALFLSPSVVIAKGPRISFSLNFFQDIPRLFLPQPAPVVYAHPAFVPYPPAYVERHTIVKEYHYRFCEHPDYYETIQPRYPVYR